MSDHVPNVTARIPASLMSALEQPTLASDPKRNVQDVSISALPNPCEDAGSLIAKAKRCRRLAAGISDTQTSDILRNLAVNYEDAAGRLTQEG